LRNGSDDTERLDRLADELHLSQALTPHLISRIVSRTCTRLPAMTRAGHAVRLERFVRAEAWTDAGLTLIEFELPLWRPRRLIYDGGEWICTLSRHPEIPIELDDAADGRHAMQAIAILLSFVDAKRLLATAKRVERPTVPQAAADPAACTFCCDNFA
jgi:hypothetical protein